ncbi:MAG: hypothetical protein LAP85_07230 [Acidobacteriia bacterium]|nr:hypothetical protein [Terriglobia bacterium]
MKTNRFFCGARRLLLLAEADAPEEKQATGSYWPVLLLSMAASAGIAVALGQDASWDVLNYHFYGGYAFLHKPLNYDFAPAQVQSFFNPLQHVLSYLMLEHLPGKVAVALLGAIQGLNCYLVFQIAQVLFRSWKNPLRLLLSLSCAAAGFYGAVGIAELGTTFGDNLGSLLILAGLLLIIRHLMLRRALAPVSIVQLAIAGVSIGFAFGLKLTVATYVAAILSSLTACLLTSRHRVRMLAAFGCGLAIGFIAAYGIWGISLYREYGNPVFPYANAIFRSPYYDLENVSDTRFLPQTWQQTLLYPFYFARKNHLVSEMDFRDVRLAFCYVALVLLAGAGLFGLFRRGGNTINRDLPRQRYVCLLFLALVFAISYVIWEHLFSIYRYLIVLELLAPTFLALVLAHFLRRKSLVFVFSLFLNLILCKSMIPPDYGRQKFDDNFLKVEIPPFHALDKCIVLMAGEEATSYIVPHFPSGTRFVRVSSNFLFVGRNPNLGEKIRKMLAQYDSARTLVYVANAGEMDVVRNAVFYYGVTLDTESCREVRSRAENRGYLCGVRSVYKPDAVKPMPGAGTGPVFRKLAHVGLEVTPSRATAGKDTIQFRVVGLKARAIDMLYTIDGESMPPLRNWPLDARRTSQIPVDTATKKGWYHIIGIRDSVAPNPDSWIEVNVRVVIK